MHGGRAREIHVVVDIEKLNSLRPVADPGARRASSPRTSRSRAARSSRARGSCCCGRSGRIDATGDFNNIVVATEDGTPIRVSDIGYAEDTLPAADQRGLARRRRRRCMLDIRRAMGENTVEVIEGSAHRLRHDPARAAEGGQAHASPATTPSSSTRRSPRSRST